MTFIFDMGGFEGDRRFERHCLLGLVRNSVADYLPDNADEKIDGGLC